MFPAQGTVGLTIQGSVELWFAVKPLELELGTVVDVANYVRYNTKCPVGEFGRSAREALFNIYAQFLGRALTAGTEPSHLTPGDILIAGQVASGARVLGVIIDSRRYAHLLPLSGSLIALPDGNAIQELGLH